MQWLQRLAGASGRLTGSRQARRLLQVLPAGSLAFEPSAAEEALRAIGQGDDTWSATAAGAGHPAGRRHGPSPSHAQELEGAAIGWQRRQLVAHGHLHSLLPAACTAQHRGVATSVARPSAASPEAEPVQSPLFQVPTPPPGAGARAAIGRAVLPRIKQSPKKVNLVAAMVRGMAVEDALLQMAVSTKRASKTVAKLVQAASANGVQNHGMDGSRLVVAEAFVGKDRFLKRMWPHGRGKSGVRERARCQLTVVVREMSAAQEAARARARSSRWSRSSRLRPHRLVTVGGGQRRPAPAAAAEAPGGGVAEQVADVAPWSQ